MNRDQAIKIILQRCGNRVNDSNLQGICVNEMTLVQQTVLERADFKPWFLLSEMLRTVTPSDGVENRVLVPLRFLEEQEEGSMWILPEGSTRYIRLVRGDPDDLEEEFGDCTGQPTRYALVKNYFVLFPTPDKEYALKVRCYQGEPTLTYVYGQETGQDAITNAWLTVAPDWLIAEVGVVVAGTYIKDPATAAEFKAAAQLAKQRLYVQHVAREEMNREREMGED